MAAAGVTKVQIIKCIRRELIFVFIPLKNFAKHSSSFSSKHFHFPQDLPVLSVRLAFKVFSYFFKFLDSVSITAEGKINFTGKLAKAYHPVEQFRDQFNKVVR
jgi:hypothetical protein